MSIFGETRGKNEQFPLPIINIIYLSTVNCLSQFAIFHVNNAIGNIQNSIIVGN